MFDISVLNPFNIEEAKIMITTLSEIVAIEIEIMTLRKEDLLGIESLADIYLEKSIYRDIQIVTQLYYF